MDSFDAFLPFWLGNFIRFINRLSHFYDFIQFLTIHSVCFEPLMRNHLLEKWFVIVIWRAFHVITLWMHLGVEFALEILDFVQTSDQFTSSITDSPDINHGSCSSKAFGTTSSWWKAYLAYAAATKTSLSHLLYRLINSVQNQVIVSINLWKDHHGSGASCLSTGDSVFTMWHSCLVQLS